MKFRPETTLGRPFFRLVDTRCQALVTDEICILVLTELGVTFVTDEHIRFIRDRISRRLKLLRGRACQRDTSILAYYVQPTSFFRSLAYLCFSVPFTRPSSRPVFLLRPQAFRR